MDMANEMTRSKAELKEIQTEGIDGWTNVNIGSKLTAKSKRHNQSVHFKRIFYNNRMLGIDIVIKALPNNEFETFFMWPDITYSHDKMVIPQKVLNTVIDMIIAAHVEDMNRYYY